MSSAVLSTCTPIPQRVFKADLKQLCTLLSSRIWASNVVGDFENKLIRLVVETQGRNAPWRNRWDYKYLTTPKAGVLG